MGTLRERLADAVACGSVAADKIFVVRRSSRRALRHISTKPVDRGSLLAPRALGADCFRDVATAALSV
jgi:hypothetical protein